MSRDEFRVTEKMKLKVEEKLKTMLKYNQDFLKIIYEIYFFVAGISIPVIWGTGINLN